MSRQEIVEIVAEEAGITKVAAAKAVDAVLDGITKVLKKMERLLL